MLAYIFSNQGWGSFVGALVTMIVLLCYKHVMDTEGKTSKVDGVWRITIGLSLIPAFATLYQRLTLPESKRFKESRKVSSPEDGSVDEIDALKAQAEKDVAKADSSNSVHSGSNATAASNQNNAANLAAAKKSHFGDFFRYFSQWRHAKILLGTAGSWFLLDIAYVLLTLLSAAFFFILTGLFLASTVST